MRDAKSLRGEYQQDFAAHGLEVANGAQRRMERSITRNDCSEVFSVAQPEFHLADPRLLDEIPSNALAISEMIRGEAANEARRPSHDNLPLTVDDPRAKVERVDANTGHRRSNGRRKKASSSK